MEKSLIKDYLQGCGQGLGENMKMKHLELVEQLSFLRLKGQGKGVTSGT